MKYGNLVVEKKELILLQQIISRIPQRVDESYKNSVTRLLEELQSAIVVDEADMPADVVRFNSVVTIMDERKKIHALQVVSPEKGNINQKRISIIAPMGLALFGYSQDDVVQWQFPVGVQSIKIVKVEQDTSELKPVGHEE